MKFCWFHLMPYRALPKDFEQKYHSVWVDVPSKLFDPVKPESTEGERLVSILKWPEGAPLNLG